MERSDTHRGTHRRVTGRGWRMGLGVLGASLVLTSFAAAFGTRGGIPNDCYDAFPAFMVNRQLMRFTRNNSRLTAVLSADEASCSRRSVRVRARIERGSGFRIDGKPNPLLVMAGGEMRRVRVFHRGKRSPDSGTLVLKAESGQELRVALEYERHR